MASRTDAFSGIAQVRAGEARTRYAPAEARALGTIAMLAALTMLCLVLPVGIGVLLGTLLALTVYRSYKHLGKRTGHPTVVAAAVSGLTTALVAGTLGVFAYLLVLQGIAIASAVPQLLGPGGAAALFLQRLTTPLSALGLHPPDLAERLRNAMGGVATSLAGWAAQIVGAVFDGALALFFMATTMFFVLVQWDALAKRAEYLMPINPHHTRRLMRELHRLGRQTVIGNFGTALIQGTIAGVGYAIAGVPDPAFFGAVTAVASLVPAFGTLLVWVPTGIVLMAIGHAGAGIFDLIWGGFVVVGLCDYLVRPKLVGGDEATSTWMMFVALFGGIKLFGVIGLLLGPLLMGFALAALRLYERTRRFRLRAGAL